MTLSKKEIEAALQLCLVFENKKQSQTVFTQVPKKVFLYTLINLIKSNGIELYQSKNTCGIAVLMHLSASNDIVSFTKFAISLYEHGAGVLNEYSIIKNHQVSIWARSIKGVGGFNGVSLVVIGAIRFVENTSLKFIPNTMDGMTWPKEISTISSKIFKGGLEKQKAIFIGWNIKKIQAELDREKNMILLYRTSAWKANGRFFKDSWHYIVLKKIKKNHDRSITLTYWDYGSIKVISLSPFEFRKGAIKTYLY